MAEPIALYRTEIRHRRTQPVEHEFTYQSYWWLVDVDRFDEIPATTRRFARFEPADYCGDPNASIADNVRNFLSDSGIDATGWTIRMLSTPRQFGYSFNPITVFYCHSNVSQHENGAPMAVVAEVHNTYGDRHRYLLLPDLHDRSDAAKELFVSPFYDVSGHYRIFCPAPGPSLALQVILHRSDEVPFVASVTGEQIPITKRTIAASLLAGSALRTGARIRRQGITLWRKGIEVKSRPQYEGAHSD